MEPEDVLLVLEVFVERCHKRASQHPLQPLALDQAMRLEIELLREELKKRQQPDPPQAS
jgi:hypothetical protein